MRAGLPDKVEVTTEKKLINGVARPDIIARTGANIIYHGPAFALLDFDSKGMPADVAAELKRRSGFWGALLTVLPALGDVARVTRRSTSAGLSRSDTGEALPGSDGVHVYVAAKDGGDSERFLRALHERCWLAGFGWMLVSASGALLERSIVDRMVGGAERLVFEGGPVLVPPLQQDKESRRPIAVDGGVLDTVAACPPLSIVERARLEELQGEGAASGSRPRWQRPARRSSRRKQRGSPRAPACRSGRQADDRPPVRGRTAAGCRSCRLTIRNWPATPSATCWRTRSASRARRWPTRSKASITGDAWPRSCAGPTARRGSIQFAHGRTIYELKLDAATVRKAMEGAAKNDVVATFVQLAVDADVDAVELEELRQLAKKLSGVGLRVIDSTLKAAQQKHNAQQAKETRHRQQAARRDPRPMIAAPFSDAPFLPVMDVLNDVIGKVTAAVPPLRDIDGVTTRVRKLPVPNMHAFTQSEANAEQEETTDD